MAHTLSKRNFWRGTVEVVSCSLATTLLALIAGLAWFAVFGTRWSLAFVIARWIFIALILLLPFIHRQIIKRNRASRGVPWVLRTPFTPLLLMVESIALDIIIARLG